MKCKNTDILYFDVAALGIIAIGLAMSMGGNKQMSTSKQYSVDNGEGKIINEEKRKRESATVEMVDLADYNEAGWVPLVH